MTHAGLLKTWATVLAAILASILLSVAAFTTGAGAQEQSLCSGKVVLDPGHGGTDSGAVKENGLREKDQNLLVATELKDLLEPEHCVYMTRIEDETLSNTQRANRANDFKAKDPGDYVLVSIHMNGSTNETVDYTTTLYGKPRKDKELAYALFFGGSVKPPSYGLRTLPAAKDFGTINTGTINTRTPYQFASGSSSRATCPRS